MLYKIYGLSIYFLGEIFTPVMPPLPSFPNLFHQHNHKHIARYDILISMHAVKLVYLLSVFLCGLHISLHPYALKQFILGRVGHPRKCHTVSYNTTNSLFSHLVSASPMHYILTIQTDNSSHTFCCTHVFPFSPWQSS